MYFYMRDEFLSTYIHMQSCSCSVKSKHYNSLQAEKSITVLEFVTKPLELQNQIKTDFKYFCSKELKCCIRNMLIFYASRGVSTCSIINKPQLLIPDIIYAHNYKLFPWCTKFFLVSYSVNSYFPLNDLVTTFELWRTKIKINVLMKRNTTMLLVKWECLVIKSSCFIF